MRPDLEAAARATLARYAPAAEPLRALYLQPDRAVFLAERAGIVLKVYAERDLLRRDWSATRRARAAGVPVPELLGFEDGDPSVMLMRWVSGRPLTGGDRGAARHAGALLAQFHRCGARPPFATGHATWPDHLLAWAEPELARVGQLGVLPDEAIASLRGRFARFAMLAADRPIALLHGDLQPDHVLVDERGERVVAFLDFADAQPGDPLLDIAVLTLWDSALAGSILVGYGGIDNDGATRALLAGYRLLRHVSGVPWLLERGYDGHAARSIAAIERALAAGVVKL